MTERRSNSATPPTNHRNTTPSPKEKPKTPRPPRFHSFFKIHFIFSKFVGRSRTWAEPRPRALHIYRVGNGAGRGALLTVIGASEAPVDVSGSVLSEIEASQSA